MLKLWTRHQLICSQSLTRMLYSFMQAPTSNENFKLIYLNMNYRVHYREDLTLFRVPVLLSKMPKKKKTIKEIYVHQEKKLTNMVISFAATHATSHRNYWAVGTLKMINFEKKTNRVITGDYLGLWVDRKMLLLIASSQNLALKESNKNKWLVLLYSQSLEQDLCKHFVHVLFQVHLLYFLSSSDSHLPPCRRILKQILKIIGKNARPWTPQRMKKAS